MSEEKPDGRVSRAHAEGNDETIPRENELEKLKEANAQQAAEIEELKEQVEELGDSKTPSLLRSTPPSQGESLKAPKQDASATMGESLLAAAPEKTQGVRVLRGGGGVLQSAAKKAAASNSRTDVQEYMRIRRNFV